MLTFHSDPISDNPPINLSLEPEAKHPPRLGFEFRPLPINGVFLFMDKEVSRCAQFVYLYLLNERNGYKHGVQTYKIRMSQMERDLSYCSGTLKNAIKELERKELIITFKIIRTHNQDESEIIFQFPIYTLEKEKVDGKWKFITAHDRRQWTRTDPAQKPAIPKTRSTQKETSKPVVEEATRIQWESPSKSCDAPRPSCEQPPSEPVVARNPQPALDSCSETPIVDPPPIVPQHIEKLSLAWNESHEYEEGEGEEFDKYFDKAIRATMKQHSVDVDVAVQALIRAFHRTKRNAAGHHPYDYPTAYTGDPDHSESKATPRGKKILRGAIHAVKSGESFSSHKQPSSSNDSIEIQNPTHENIDTGDSVKGSAPPQPDSISLHTPQTPLELVRRNLVGRAAMLKAGIISPLSRDEVLSHAQPGLDAFDDIPGDDVILGVWDELIPDAVEKADEDTPPAPAEQPAPETNDAFMELGEIQAKIAGLDEMRRSGTLSVDEIAEVTQEIAALKRQKAKVQRDADKCSASADQDSDKGVSDGVGAIETGKGGSTTGDSLGRRIARTIKSSLMADKEYSDEQIVLIVQRQERSIDSAAILEVWHNWSDWSAYLEGIVNQRIQSGVLMPDEVREARSYAARLKDWERKNEQWEAVV